MSVASGKGRLLQGSPADRVKRQNLTEFRGTIWEAVNDWFFGVNTVDYDWRESSDNTKVTKWVFTQDGASDSAATVDTQRRRLDIGLVTGADNGSNQRELWTIPETAPWGVSHALTEIKAEAYGVVDGANVKPQHGLGLQAQEDVKRRAILVWHDVVIGNPHVINVGVWEGNLDGSDFANRGGNVAFELGQRYTLSNGSRTSNVVTATCTGHNLETGEYLDINWTREFAGTSMTRTSNVVTASIGSGHEFETGDAFTIGLGSPASFDGSFTVASFTGTTISWNQTGSNQSGTGTVKDQSSNVTQVKVTVVDGNTIQYPDARHDRSDLGTGTDGAFRKFPYFMEVRVSGTNVWVRCWDRSQAKPDWVSPGHALIVDLDKANRSYSVTASSRTSNVATLTIGAHDVIPGNLIDVTGIADGSFNTGFGFVTAVGATTVDYHNPGTNTGSGGTGTAVREGGSFDAAGLADIPTPRGSGRIAIVNSHAGVLPFAHVSYADVIGANSFDITFQPALQATEFETAQPITRLMPAIPVNQAIETETATVVGRSKVEQVAQAIETETATVTRAAHQRTLTAVIETETATTATRIKVRTLGQVTELETATATGKIKIESIAQVTEIETATTATAAHSRTVASVVETETATSTGKTKIGTVPQAIEVESATVFTEIKSAIVAQAIESETATPIDGTKIRSVAQVTETETATSTGVAKQVTASQAVELEVAQGLTKRLTTGQAIENELALIITPFTNPVLGQAAETESAQPIGRSKTQLAGQVIELEAALNVSLSRPVAAAIEIEQGLTITGVKQLLVGQPTEVELASPIALVRGGVLQITQELEFAQMITAIGGAQGPPPDHQPIGFGRPGEDQGIVFDQPAGIIFRRGEGLVVREGS